MALNDFARRILGLPEELFGAQPGQPGQPVSGPQASPAAIANPMLQQQQADMQQAAMQRMGQLGMLLMAAGQRMTPRERATILAQAPQFMDGMQTDVAQAAQARLVNSRAQSEQADMARAEAMRNKLSDPQFLQSLGVSPQVAEVLGEAGIRKLIENQAMANTPDAIQDRKLKDAQIQHYLNQQRTGPSPQLVDLPGGGKGWATPGSSDIVPIGGAGKGGVDPENAKRSDAEEKNLTYAKEAISAHRVLSDPVYSGDLTSGYKKRVNAIPTIDGSWAGEKYLTGDSQANSFVDSVVRPRSGAVVGPTEMADKKRIFTPMPGDSQDLLLRKAQMRAQHIESLIAGANPADRPMLQQMYQESVKELERVYKDGQQPARTDAPSRPGVRSITPIN